MNETKEHERKKTKNRKLHVVAFFMGREEGIGQENKTPCVCFFLRLT